jgi:hypothetical protein
MTRFVECAVAFAAGYGGAALFHRLLLWITGA